MLGDRPPAPFDPTVLRRTADLRRHGVELRRRSQPTHHQVRHGVWVDAQLWRALPPVTKHAAVVHATALVCAPESDSIYSHESAAAIWGLPRIEEWPSLVHVTTLRSVRSSGLIVRHRCEVDAYLVRHGVRVTLPARTVVDLARSGSFVTGLAAADFALRHELATEHDLVDLIPPRGRGRARAALVVDLADGRSMSAGESLSRAQMFRLNLPRPELQVPYWDDAGFVGQCDFGWEGVVGEFDGRVKYRVPSGADPSAAGEVVWLEKKREDRLRRKGLAVARWVYADALRPQRMASVLAAQGVKPDPRRSWITLAPRTADWR